MYLNRKFVCVVLLSLGSLDKCLTVHCTPHSFSTGRVGPRYMYRLADNSNIVSPHTL